MRLWQSTATVVWSENGETPFAFSERDSRNGDPTSTTPLSAASAATFQAIRGKGDHINDYARLLVTEELLLTDGSTFTWEYFQPVQLVQQVLDKCSGIARLYAEKLRDNPPSPDKPWRIVLGCDEHTPGSKVVSVNRREKHGSRLQLCRVRARHPRDVNEDYKLRAGIDDEWVYVPDKTARKNKVVQCNEEEIDAEIDEGCVEDLKKKKCVKRTASELEESELATPEGGKKKRRG